MSSEILSKEPPPPLVDDRSTKKARFREQGVDADNPPPLSFKDKLMEDQDSLKRRSWVEKKTWNLSLKT
ncbi:hypothetical protein AB3S75_013074 [Citrus x aurantiifolia]